MQRNQKMETIFTFNAYIGSILLAICAAPLAWRAYKDGHSKGVDEVFLWTWFTGEVLLFTYALHLKDLPLIFNYGLNLIFICIVVYYKVKPRRM